MAAPEHETHHLLVQAPIRPLDEDGITVCWVGTAGFALALAVLWLRHSTLQAHGHGWYEWVCVCGIVLGLLGLVWCRRRRTGRGA